MIVRITLEVYSLVETNLSYTNLIFMGSKLWFPRFIDNTLLCISHSKWGMCTWFPFYRQVNTDYREPIL